MTDSRQQRSERIRTATLYQYQGSATLGARLTAPWAVVILHQNDNGLHWARARTHRRIERVLFSLWLREPLFREAFSLWLREPLFFSQVTWEGRKAEGEKIARSG